MPRSSADTEIPALPVVPKAREHEPFGVWYARIAKFYQVTPERLSARIGLPTEFPYRRDFVAQPIKDEDLYLLCQAFRVPRVLIGQLFANQHVSRPSLSAGVCPVCVHHPEHTDRRLRRFHEPVNPYAMVCTKHRCLLRRKTTNTKNTLPSQATNQQTDCTYFNDDILALSNALGAREEKEIRVQRFSIADRCALQRVCRDVLDALLARTTNEKTGSCAARFATLLNDDDMAAGVSVCTESGSIELLNRVRSFENRRWAFGLCSALLQASAANADENSGGRANLDSS